MRLTLSYLATALLLLGSSLPACGSDSDTRSGPHDGGDGGSGGSDGGSSPMGGAGGSGPSGGSGPMGGSGGGGMGGSDQFVVVCDNVATALCEARQPCCEGADGFDMATCVARELESCAADAERVRTGEYTFDEAALDPCLARVDDVFGDCDASTFRLVTEHASFFAECTGIFSGSVPLGGACTADEECDRSNASGFVSCDEGTCSELVLAGEGQPCGFGAGEALCEFGQYCDTDFSAPGTCAPATPLGQSCDTNVALNLECGLLNYCEASTGQCTPGKAEGAPCASDIECESIMCPAGTCVGAAEGIVTSEACGL